MLKGMPGEKGRWWPWGWGQGADAGGLGDDSGLGGIRRHPHQAQAVEEGLDSRANITIT